MSAVYTTIYIKRKERGSTMEHKVEVKFDYRRAHKGARDSILEFIHARKVPGGEYIELSDEEIDEAEEQAWQEREDALMDCDKIE